MTTDLMNLKPANQRVIDALHSMNIQCEVRILDHDTRTSAAAAQSLGCSVSQIAKSLIFKTQSNRPVLAITSGSNRVKLAVLSEYFGEQIGKADAEFVRTSTGFAIGGVAPVGLINPIDTVFDPDLFLHETVWAAAGTPNSLFPIDSADLPRLARSTGDRIFPFTESLT